MSDTEPTYIPSTRVWNAIRELGVDPYGVTSIHIDTLFVEVTRAEIGADGEPIVEAFPIERKGLLP